MLRSKLNNFFILAFSYFNANVFLCLLLLIICDSQPVYSQPNVNAFDNSLYPMLIKQVQSNGLWENREENVQVRIDPRPLMGAPESVEEGRFAKIEETNLGNFTQLMRTYGAIPADIEKDNICLNTGGLQPPPQRNEEDAKQRVTEHCKKIGNFVTIAFGLPRLDKSLIPDEMNSEEEKQWYVVRAIEISSYTLGVYDLVFTQKNDSRWEFIKKHKILMVMS